MENVYNQHIITSHLGGSVWSVWGGRGCRKGGMKFTSLLSDDALMHDHLINMILTTAPCESINVTGKNKQKKWKSAP